MKQLLKIFREVVLMSPEKPWTWLETCSMVGKLDGLEIRKASFALKLHPKDEERGFDEIAELLSSLPEKSSTIKSIKKDISNNREIFMIRTRLAEYVDESPEFWFLELWKSEGGHLNISAISTNWRIIENVKTALLEKPAEVK